MPDFLLPDLGEGLESATIVTWHVGVGDTVAVDQPVVEVETAKAAVEVPIPFAGVVSQLHGEPGTAVRVGRPLISVEPARVDGADTPVTQDVPAAGGSPVAGGYDGFVEPGVETAPARSGSGNVLIGYGTSEDRPRRRGGRSRRRETVPAASVASVPAATARSSAPAPARTSGPTPVISPLVRKYARDHGVDVATVAGTGPSGLVRRADIEQVLAARTPPTPPTPPAAASPAGGDGLTRIPLSGVRRAMADTLSRSRREIPEATVWVDVDATGLLAARAELNARSPHAPVSLLALLARFVVLGLRRYPELNARVESDAVVLSDRVNVGFAAQTDRGLMVPVVHDAQSMTLRDLSDALGARTREARDGALTPAALTGGTITVNNYGVFGVDGSAAIINHPEVAIVGMGRIIDRPWVVGGQIAVRKVSELTLAFDHRVCDGGTAGGFLRYLADCVESPITALGDA